MDAEEAYNGFRRVIETANVILATYADELMGEVQVCLSKKFLYKSVQWRIGFTLQLPGITKRCTRRIICWEGGRGFRIELF